MVNLEWYRTFKAIYQQGTLTRAAEILMISQPNVSIQLASLENYIGQNLFSRQPRKMVPTEYGKLLYTQIVDSIDNLERVENELKKTVLKKKPSIRLGLPSEITQTYFTKQINTLEPNIIIEYGLAHDFISLLKKNDLDIAFITKQDEDENNLTYKYLYTEKFMIVCNLEQDTSEMDLYIKEADFLKLEKCLSKKFWYAYNSNLPIIRRFWKSNFFKRPLMKPKVVIPDYNAIIQSIMSCGGFAVVSDLIAGTYIKSNKIKIVWEGIVPSTNSVFLAYDNSKISPEIVQHIEQYLAKVINPYMEIKY